MGQAKSDLIRKISGQFVSKVTPGYLRFFHISSGYFNAGRPEKIKNDALGKDISVMNRIFDDIKVDSSTSEEFYNAIMQSSDPIHEILIPLIDSIAEQMLDPEHKQLNAKIRSDFENYDAVRNRFTDIEFQDTMLRAIGSACLAMTTDSLTQKLLKSSEDEQVTQSRRFSAKIAIPFDEYIKTLSAQKFRADVEIAKEKAGQQQPISQSEPGFIMWVLMALLSVLNWFTQRRGQDQAFSYESVDDKNQIQRGVLNDPLETKIDKLKQIVDRALDKMGPQGEANVFVKQVQKFRDNLDGLIEEIYQSREMEIDYKAKVQTGFDGLCQGFTERLGTYIKEQGQSIKPEDQEAIASIVADLTDNLASKEDDALIDHDDDSEHGYSPGSSNNSSRR